MARSISSVLRLFFAVHHFRKFHGEALFRRVDALVPMRAQFRDLFERQKGEKFQTFFHVRVVHVSPILIEFVRARFVLVQPDGALRRFTHFTTVRGGEKRERHRERGLLLLAADEVRAREDIAPLVVAAQFEFTAVFFIEHEKIVRLHEHIVEFEEGKPSLVTRLETFRRKHLVHGKMHLL